MPLYVSQSLAWMKGRGVILLLLAAALVQGGISGFTLTFFPLLLQHEGQSALAIGLANSSQMGAIIAVTLILPYFLHRLPLPGLYVASCAIGTVAILCLNYATTHLPLHILLRFAMGACVSVMYIVLEYWLNATVEARYRGLVLGAYGMAIVTGMGAGPLMIAQTGTTGLLPFAFGAILFLACASIKFFARQGAPTAHLTGTAPQGNPFRILHLAPALAAAGLLHGVVESGMYAFLPLYGMGFGLTEAQGARLLTCIFWGAILLQLLLGWLADRWNALNTLRLAAGINAAGAMLLPFFLPQADGLLWCYMLIWGGTIPTIYTLTSTCIGHRYQGDRLAHALLTFILMYGLGSLIGPNLTGWIIEHITGDALPWVMTLAYGLCLVFLLFSRQKRLQEASA